jgi:hypothetical protein
MRFLAPFVLFGSRSALEEGRIDCHVRDWRRVLQALHEGCFDLAQAEKIDHLNDHLDTLTLESA